MDPSIGSDWVNALVDLFTVVEFPVLGYQPPAVLTEMHFQKSWLLLTLLLSAQITEEGSDVTLLPDLDDAMVELSEKKTSNAGKEKPKAIGYYC